MKIAASTPGHDARLNGSWIVTRHPFRGVNGDDVVARGR
jgi:hypothetical protein